MEAVDFVLLFLLSVFLGSAVVVLDQKKLDWCNKIIDNLSTETVLIIGVVCGLISVLSGIFLAQSKFATLFGFACFSYPCYRLSKYYTNRKN